LIQGGLTTALCERRCSLMILLFVCKRELRMHKSNMRFSARRNLARAMLSGGHARLDRLQRPF
jgi:hypothetical protein